MFDALSYSESLVNIGVPEDQAKLQAKVMSKAFESNDLATKADITELRVSTKADITELRVSTKADITELRVSTKADITELKADITELRAGTKADIAELKTGITEMELRMIKWQIGGIGLVIAAIKFL